MIKLTLIVLSKRREKYLCDGSDEYEKRLSRYCKLQIVELEPERLPENPSKSQIDGALAAEGAAILKKIPAGAFVTALCVEGKRMSSEEFSELITAKSPAAGGLVFIIGSSYGIHDSVKSAAHLKLSASDMTFPHQLFRIMLLEQIYRGFKIEEGGKYHK